MKLLKDSKEIQNTLKKMKPYRIAVAYVGKDFADFIDVATLDIIIISPTIGTNPYAITNLVRAKGWQSIFFLDNLHAKIYLSDSSAIITSANLTANALDMRGSRNLVEVGILIDDNSIIKEIELTFEEIFRDATLQYPKKEDKEKKLKELYKKWDKYPEMLPRNDVIDFADYSKDNDFKVCWYEPGDALDYDRALNHFYPNIPTGKMSTTEKQAKIYERIKGYINFPKGDEIVVGDWILLWKRIKNFKCSRAKTSIEWVHVDEIVKNLSTDVDYPHVAIEINKPFVSTPPFKITETFKKVFCDVIDRSEFSVFRGDDNVFRVKDTLGSISDLLKALSQEYLKTTKR